MQKLQFGWQPIPCVGCSMDNVVIDNNCYGGQLGHLITHIELVSTMSFTMTFYFAMCTFLLVMVINNVSSLYFSSCVIHASIIK